MKTLLAAQYEMVMDSRDELLGYCSQMTPVDFVMEHTSFGKGSVRNMLVHIGTTYQHWLGQLALRKAVQYPAYPTITTIKKCRLFFEEIDTLVHEFLNAFADDYLHAITVDVDNNAFTATPLKLFTHVMTHEFHHKGQILSLSRHLGYIPVDTDIMR